MGKIEIHEPNYLSENVFSHKSHLNGVRTTESFFNWTLFKDVDPGDCDEGPITL